MINYGLKDKIALITGANTPRGIGAATALAFAREGAKVVLVYQKIANMVLYLCSDMAGGLRVRIFVLMAV